MPDSLAEVLNRDCRCISIDHAALERETRRQLGDSGIALPPWAESSLFAQVPVFVSRAHLQTMHEVIVAVHALVQSPTYRQIVLERAPAIARHCVRQHGVYFGYDFHLGVDGPALIEVNTNAGGPLLNLLLARAQQLCCEQRERLVLAGDPIETLDAEFVAMFQNEWRLARGDAPLGTIAIVDDEPERQFLHPEFMLFRQLFRRSGWQAFVLSPEQLRQSSDGLYFEDQRIDLVYNRLVDFYFEESTHQALRQAYLEDKVVVTPHPRAHALYADKRNLITLRDSELHRDSGLSEIQSERLVAHIPETKIVEASDADRLWGDRKRWFFKPIHGYGGKAAYRGDKLTRSTFEQIVGRDYVAQRIVPPSQRHVEVNGDVVPLKLDLRCFAYDTDVQLVAARLYHGQTTNFRTVGGGFAPVFTEVREARE